MLFFLLIVTAAVVFADEAQIKVEEEPKPEESIHEYSFKDGLELIRHRNQQLQTEKHRMFYSHKHDDEHDYNKDHHLDYLDDHDKPGPVILRTPHPLAHDGHIDYEAQNRIIEDVYSPDYHQPTWVLDYRYLKTGGRDYTRGPGGQILILPKGVRSKEHKEFPDYDSYLEHLRLRRLAAEQHYGYGKGQHGYENVNNGDNQHGYKGHHGYYGHNDHHNHHSAGRDNVDRDHDHGHGQTKWRKF